MIKNQNSSIASRENNTSIPIVCYDPEKQKTVHQEKELVNLGTVPK
jgi:hypothetical protein